MIVPVFIPTIPNAADPTEHEARWRLLYEMTKAHYLSFAGNENASRLVLQTTAYASPFRPTAAIAASLLTIGERHGPLFPARMVQRMSDDELRELVASGKVVPGYGNHFYKESIDVAWTGVDAVLEDKFPTWHQAFWRRAGIVREKSPTLWPNPGGYTGLIADIVELPDGYENVLAMIPRVVAGLDIVCGMDALERKKEKES